MTDQPGNEPEERLPAPRPETPASVERFSAPPGAHKFELTPERSAQIVRQSSNARWVGFLAVIVVVLFVALYWFYELGAPLGLTEPRLSAEENAQQVLAIERGYNIYQANCALCHGANGEGGIGPTLNRQDKLFTHLNEDYLHNILEVGGRLACGDPLSAMPIWSNEGRPPGPLNYVQIEELIAFLRATNDTEYLVRNPELMEPEIDPETGEPETFVGWRDPNYKPAPDATPYPECWKNEFTSGESAAPNGSGGPEVSGQPATSGGPGTSGEPSASLPGQAPSAAEVEIVAQNVEFTTTEVSVAGTDGFTIQFDNQDASIPHDVDILDASGGKAFDGEVVSGPVVQAYNVPAIEAGDYEFICSVHPNMTGTISITQ